MSNNHTTRKNTKTLRSLESIDSALLEAVIGGAGDAMPSAEPVSAPATCNSYILIMDESPR